MSSTLSPFIPRSAPNSGPGPLPEELPLREPQGRFTAIWSGDLSVQRRSYSMISSPVAPNIWQKKKDFSDRKGKNISSETVISSTSVFMYKGEQAPMTKHLPSPKRQSSARLPEA